MTINALIANLSALTAEQREQEAAFFEPYDEGCLLTVDEVCVAKDDFVDGNGHEFKAGTVYLA